MRAEATKDARIRYHRVSEALMNLSSTARQIVFWLLIIAGALLLYKLVNPRGNTSQPIDLTTLDAKIQSGDLKQLTVKQNETVAIDSHNQTYTVQLSNDAAIPSSYQTTQRRTTF